MFQRYSYQLRFAFLLMVFCAVAPARAQIKVEWLPVTPEDLSLKDVPGVSGAHAITLYREANTDDMLHLQWSYTRIKILAEEGRKYANIEIPFWRIGYKIDDLQARTIRPDGTVVPFTGKIFEKTVAKLGEVRIQVKSFTLPDVQAGSIIEYRYTVRWEPYFWLRPEWVIQDDLYTRRARFSFRPSVYDTVQWMGYGLPEDRKAVVGSDHVIRLEVEDIPALVREEHMPPDSEVQMRAEFFYVANNPETTEAYWKRIGKAQFKSFEDYLEKDGAMRKAVNEIISASDPPEIKLRKIYARVQQIRNLSFERSKSEQEEKRENRKVNNHVEDVWTRGYGTSLQINLLFAALARAAGFPADLAILSARNKYFFKREMPDARQLNTNAVLVRVGEKDFYLDPGMVYCPFGMLPWASTGVEGLRLDRMGGTMMKSPIPRSTDAVTERRATLALQEDGTLKGRVEVIFSGYEAQSFRQAAQDHDETARRKSLEDEVKTWLPAAAAVKLERVTGWEGNDAPLQAEFGLEIPGYALVTGRRLLVPAAVFDAFSKHPFEHAKRMHPVYFSYPWQSVDNITLELPASYRVENVPTTRHGNFHYGTYEITRELNGRTLRVERHLVVEGFFIPVEEYASLKKFFDTVRAGDEEQIVLQLAQSAPRN